MFKTVIFFLITILLTAGCAPVSFAPIIEEAEEIPWVKPSYILPELSITVLQTGKSDMIVIETENRLMVIDTADRENRSKIQAHLRDRKLGVVDYLVLTHLDKDHIGGTERVIGNFTVKNIIQPNYTETSDEYAGYVKAYGKKGLTPLLLTRRMEFEFAGAWVRLLPAAKDEYEKENDYSIMTEIIYGDHRFLFAGDAESERLREYLRSDPEPFDFVKMLHHGNYNERTAEFIQKTAPKYAVITCSEDNMPDKEVTKLLRDVGSNVLLTILKPVTVVSDGVELKVN